MNAPEINILHYNPNFTQDVKKYLQIDLDEGEVDNRLRLLSRFNCKIYENLVTLIDRLEFIDHLQDVASDQGKKIAGFRYDVNSLRLYLALTCIDVVGNGNVKKTLVEKKPFLASIQKDLMANLTVESREKESNNLDEIAQYLYTIRNKYTHQGCRVFANPTGTFTNIIAILPIGPHQMEEIKSSANQFDKIKEMVFKRRDTDERKLLKIKPGFDLVKAILKVARLGAKDTFMTDKHKYIPQEIEPKWQQKWADDKLYKAEIDESKEKLFYLTMLPYPSGDLHIGHWYCYVPSDAQARFYRMQGYNVMFPVGFDAFGLPAENAAIQRGVHPKEWTFANIERMRGQLRSMGAMWDWQRQAVSADPEYYRWTQWFFLQFYQHGLAYKARSAVDFCPQCNTTLAREQVWGEDRHCERCKTPVIKKDLEQWFFRTTQYAEELLDHSKIDWPERVETMQTNWIGRSEGADVVFKSEQGDEIVVFTTRPDTLWGATFMVLAPEHPLVDKLTAAGKRAEVETYTDQATRQSEIDRTATDKEKTGVFIGAHAINPVNGKRIPIWIADYVLMSYGTGAIMAVPAHDERDFEFALKYALSIPVVIAPPDWDGEPLNAAYPGEGVMVNSGSFDGTPTADGESVRAVAAWLEEKGIGQAQVRYRLHDWLISRQRYWGAPIPMIYCDECGIVPVPKEDLPVLLPDDIEFMPTGESPLKFHAGFMHTTCPQCNGPAQRETDTMDTFMCSSWYQYRYLSPDYDQGPWDPAQARYWLPVDQYTGGIEHATMHLIYTRFFSKALRDIGILEFDEPMLRLYNQGMVLGEDGEKMSKSRGNVVAPDELVSTYGADTVRTYLMFFSRWEQGGPWDSQGIKGPRRFVEDVWNLVVDKAPEPATAPSEVQVRALRRKTHQTIAKVSADIKSFSFNTAVAALMELRNTLQDAKNSAPFDQAHGALYGSPAWDEAIEMLLLLLCPIAPHITEELWARLGKPYSIHQQPWPAWDTDIAAEENITLVVQINGKLRDRIQAPAGVSQAQAKELALTSENVQRHLAGKEPRKVVVVPGKLVNIVA